MTYTTPDDGQRNCPKRVEFHSKNKFEKLVHLVGFIVRNFCIYVYMYIVTCWWLSIQILYQLLQNVEQHDQAAQSFYQTYFTDILQHIFSVVTDTSHTAGE